MSKEYDVKLINRITKIKNKLNSEKEYELFTDFNEGLEQGCDLALKLLETWVKKLRK